MNVPRSVFRNVLNTWGRNVCQERSERTLSGVPGGLDRDEDAANKRTTLREVPVEVGHLPERYQLSGEPLSDSAETSGPTKDTDAMTEGNHVPETGYTYSTDT